MVYAFRRYHVVPGLGSAVVTHNNAGLGLSDKEVRDQPFTGVAKSEISDDICAQFCMLS